MSTDATHYGFKKITFENWLSPDVPIIFPGITPELWIPEVLKPQLGADVPEQICALFEAARAMFVYGYLFYPLLTLAGQQCQRVAEAAVCAKCRAIGLPQKTSRTGKKRPRDFKFSENIDRLIANGIISKKDERRWTATRNLRNMGSHPSFQEIIPPGMALGVLLSAAELINGIFPANSSAPT
ncbi:MAG TPA: hypothetical protein VJ063_15440 [Verrucomicrobiae bacterium]|nr:hypothetical protein [Verrucomicrobiae bacterium]